MADQSNLDLVKLEKRIFALEQVLQIFDEYMVSVEESYRALERLLAASNNATDTESQFSYARSCGCEDWRRTI